MFVSALIAKKKKNIQKNLENLSFVAVQRCVTLVGKVGFLFFLSSGSQKAPDHPQTRKSRFLIGKSTISERHVLVFSILIEKSGKISENRPEMAREDTQR